MAPKRDPRKAPVPAPAPADFLGAKKKPLSAAAAAKSAGGPPSSRPSQAASATITSGAAESNKRQRNSPGEATGAGPKKHKEAYDPLAMAQPLGAARNPPPSPTTSVSTVHSEVTDGGPGPVLDREVGDEREQIKACISGMEVQALPFAGQVGLNT